MTLQYVLYTCTVRTILFHSHIPYTVHTTHILYSVCTMYFVCSSDSDFTSVHPSSSHTYSALTVVGLA